jgi:hypothetical protein
MYYWLCFINGEQLFWYPTTSPFTIHFRLETKMESPSVAWFGIFVYRVLFVVTFAHLETFNAMSLARSLFSRLGHSVTLDK